MSEPDAATLDAGEPVPAASVLPPPDPDLGSAPAAPRPEVAIGGAFAGGLLAALVLKRLGR